MPTPTLVQATGTLGPASLLPAEVAPPHVSGPFSCSYAFRTRRAVFPQPVLERPLYGPGCVVRGPFTMRWHFETRQRHGSFGSERLEEACRGSDYQAP